MINNVEDYKFVRGANIDAEHPHGDLDRIIINGEIMPLRSGLSPTTGVERKRILRGEDVAFLNEAVAGRYKASGYSRIYSSEFSRKLRKYGLFTLESDIRSLFRGWESDRFWYNSALPSPLPPMGAFFVTSHNDDPFADVFAASDSWLSPSDCTIETIDFWYGEPLPLSLSYMESLFENIAKVTDFLFRLNEWDFVWTTNVVSITGEGAEYHKETLNYRSAIEAYPSHYKAVDYDMAMAFRVIMRLYDRETMEPVERIYKTVVVRMNGSITYSSRELVPQIMEAAGVTWWEDELARGSVSETAAYAHGYITDGIRWDT